MLTCTPYHRIRLHWNAFDVRLANLATQNVNASYQRHQDRKRKRMLFCMCIWYVNAWECNEFEMMCNHLICKELCFFKHMLTRRIKQKKKWKRRTERTQRIRERKRERQRACVLLHAIQNIFKSMPSSVFKILLISTNMYEVRAHVVFPQAIQHIHTISTYASGFNCSHIWSKSEHKIFKKDEKKSFRYSVPFTALQKKN